MKQRSGSSIAPLAICLPVCLFLFSQLASAQVSSFEHVILVIQENRTPDNLFSTACENSPCSTPPGPNDYDLQTSNWLDKEARRRHSASWRPLNGGENLTHTYTGFVHRCDLNPSTGACRMDGNSTRSTSQTMFSYVDNSTGDLDPYLQLVSQYGWANYMFQTNQGPSLPAHQFLFGATAAPSAADDALGLFVDGNEGGDAAVGGGGCESKIGAKVDVIAPISKQDSKVFPCFEHLTLPDLLPSGFTWRYYSVGSQNWNAPVDINHICQPSEPDGGYLPRARISRKRCHHAQDFFERCRQLQPGESCLGHAHL
jgi:hypothetical protein